MNNLHKGSCLCGAVRFVARGALREVIYCHCNMCRKQSGHYYAATNVSDDMVDIEGGANVTWFAASDFARRGFCSRCGSVMFWKPNDDDYISIMAGSFEEPSSLAGGYHIFVAEKGSYYEIDDNLPRYERSSPSLKVLED